MYGKHYEAPSVVLQDEEIFLLPPIGPLRVMEIIKATKPQQGIVRYKIGEGRKGIGPSVEERLQN